MTDTSAPELVLYGKPGCGLCEETRELLEALLERRATLGLRSPTLVERDITTDPDLERAFFETIPVLEVGDERLGLAIRGGAIRSFLARTLDGIGPEATT